MTHRDVDQRFVTNNTIVLSSKEIEGYTYTGKGININHLNSKLSEFTHIYWLWKNRSRVGNVELNHYRRYLTNDSIKYRATKYSQLRRNSEVEKITCVKATWLRWHGIPLSIKNHWRINHVSDDLDYILSQVKNRDLAKRLKKYFGELHKVSLFNMFQMSDKLFDEYCSWIFEILLDLDLLDYADENSDVYQGRMLAFFGERLTSYWIHELSNAEIVEKAYYKFPT